MSNSRENFSRVVVILAFLTWFSGHFLVAVAATTGSYLRKSRSPSRYLNSFQQQLQVPRQEELQKMSQNMGATLSKRRRFYARYDSEEGRLLVQQLCGIGKIVEDLDTTNYTLFEDEDNDDNDDEDKGLPVSAMSATSCWKKLQGHTEIRWVEEDHPVRAFSIEGTDNNDIDESNDAMVSWGIGAVQADQLEVGPHGVTVCVVDTGIADHHPDFNYDRISGVDRIDRPTAWYWNRDRAGHGTHVSGIVAASSNNGYGIKGVGDFSLLIVRALGDDGTGFESDIWKAVETCIDHGANIINMSLGNREMSNAAKEIYTKAVEEQGVVLVAASGNDNDDTRYFPASHPSVISVGALGSSGTRYFSSNFNDQVEFVAPGQDIVSTTVSTNALQTANFAYPANTVLGTARTSVAGNLVACDMSRVVDKGICEEVQEQANGICMFAMNSAVDDKKTFDVPVEDLVEVCVTSGGIGAVVYDESLGGRPIPNLYAFGTSPIPAIAVSKTSAYQILETMELEGTSDNFQVGIGDAENDRIEYTFAVLSGTSMAAPHVTAAFALLKSHYPQCSQWQIRLALAETATNPDGNGVCNDEYGYGLVQVKDAFDWLESKGDCEDWIPEQVSAGGCQTQSFSAAASPSPTKSPTTKPTEALTEAPTPEPTPAITMQPTPVPTITLTPAPTRLPTTVSATLPSPVLTRLPTAAPVLFGPGPPSSNQTSSSNSIVSHWYND